MKDKLLLMMLLLAAASLPVRGSDEELRRRRSASVELNSPMPFFSMSLDPGLYVAAISPPSRNGQYDWGICSSRRLFPLRSPTIISLILAVAGSRRAGREEASWDSIVRQWTRAPS